MKLARKSLSFIIALALLAICLLVVGFSPLILPNYKETIEELETPKNSNPLYINGSEELNLYPWNLYTGREPERSDEWMIYFAVNNIRALGDDSWKEEEIQPLMRFRYSDQGMWFLKDAKLSKESRKQYLVNMAFDAKGLCYFSYMNPNEPEVTSEEMNQALRKLQEDWDELLTAPVPYGEWETSEWIPPEDGALKTDNAFYTFFLSYQMLENQEFSYPTKEPYVMWDLIMKTQFTSLSYDNHIYLMYSDDSGTSLVLIYSPIEKCFIGFSLKY